MSYPDLGCFSDCLVCELCGGLPPLPGLPDNYTFGGVPAWADPGQAPEPAPAFQLPEPAVYPTLSFDPPGIGIGGRF